MAGKDLTALTDLMRVLRAARVREFDALFHDKWPPPGSGAATADEPLASAARIHDDAQAVLLRIDAAEQAMRGVLQAWERDPARRGAHLLQASELEPASGADQQAEQDLQDAHTVPAGTMTAELPDTVAAQAHPLPHLQAPPDPYPPQD